MELNKPLLRLVDSLPHPLQSPARLRGNPVVKRDIEVIFSDVTCDGLSGGVSQTQEVEPPDGGQLFCLVNQVEDGLQRNVAPLVELEVLQTSQVAGLGHLQQERVHVLGWDTEGRDEDGEPGQVGHRVEETGQKVERDVALKYQAGQGREETGPTRNSQGKYQGVSVVVGQSQTLQRLAPLPQLEQLGGVNGIFWISERERSEMGEGCEVGLVNVAPGKVGEGQTGELRDMTEGKANVPSGLHQMEGGEGRQQSLGSEHQLLVGRPQVEVRQAECLADAQTVEEGDGLLHQVRVAEKGGEISQGCQELGHPSPCEVGVPLVSVVLRALVIQNHRDQLATV